MRVEVIVKRGDYYNKDKLTADLNEIGWKYVANHGNTLEFEKEKGDLDELEATAKVFFPNSAYKVLDNENRG